MSTLDFFNPFYHPKCPGDLFLLQLYRNMEQPQVNPKQPGTVLNSHGDGPEQHESHFGNFWTKKKPPGSNLAASIIQERDYS